jgi:iron-sulfur cluster repair protein YtfE (RIC family)
MTPSQVRAELLGEHFELRRLIEQAQAMLGEGSSPARIDLRAAVDRLADALLQHSQHEEAALRVILAAVQGRAHPDAVMDEHHVAEHARLVAVLHAAVDDSDASAVRTRVVAALDELESHMAEEEEMLLGEDLLGDGATPTSDAEEW